MLIALPLSTWAEPGGVYTLTGKEKGVAEIIKADMRQHPSLYKGESLNSYIKKFKQENKIGKRKLSPGDQLHFPDTLVSLKAKRTAAVKKNTPAESSELPLTFKLRNLDQVVQEGSYCVPASGEVIAKFHDIETDQWEIAKLSSQDSMDNSGTYPIDMARALENFGIRYHRIDYKHKRDDVDGFIKKTLPQFKKALVNDGPVYISIREIFGGNHGCIVIGYNDKSEKMYFYNPWGDEFNLSYKEAAKYSYDAFAFTPPKLLEDTIVDCTALIETLKQAVPNNSNNVKKLSHTLNAFNVSFELIECNRMDIMNDASKTERLARSNGQKLIDLTLERVPAIVIPQTNDEGIIDYIFITKAQESKKKLLVQRIGSGGWGTPEISSSRILIRDWTTPVDVNGKKQWRLPLFEFSGEIIAQQ